MPEIEKPFRKTGDAAISESPLHPRRKSHRIMVGPVPVGGGAPISVQSMTNTLTADVPATLQQIAELTAAGCDIVRVAVPSQDDADALPEIVKKSPIPVIADIHFQSKYVFQAIDAGCAAVRVNPGNIRKFDEVGPSICKAATDAGISLRIGVNAGSLDKELYAKYGGPTPEALVASAMKEARMFEDVGFHDFKISVKMMWSPWCRRTVCWLPRAIGRCIWASPKPARPGRAQSKAAWHSARCWPKASAIRSAFHCPRLPWRK